MSMEGLRKGAQNISTKGKGGSRSAFFAQWRPPQISIGAGMGKNRITFDLKPFLSAPPSEESKVEAAEAIVLIPGAYEDVYATYPEGHPQAGQRILPSPTVEGLHFRAHSFNIFVQGRNPSEKGFNSFREVVCSSGPEPHAPQACVGCYQVDHGNKDAKSKDQWAFNIAHLGWYHMVPLVKDNQVQMKRDGSGPVMIKQECLSQKPEMQYLGRAMPSGRVPHEIGKKFKQCEGCQQNAQWAWGDHRVLKLGFKHLRNLFEIDDKIGKKCLNCGTGILRVAFDCEKCNGEILDLSTVNWTNEQIDTFSKTAASCQHCQHYALPVSGYECGFDDNYNKVAQPCQESKKTTIFDCVLWVQREGEATESEVVVKRVVLISQYQTHDNRPLQDYLKEIVKEPFNLTEMYKPESTDEQAETIRVQNPYQTQPQYQAYGGQPQPGQPQGYPAPGQPQQGYAPPQPGGPQQGYQQPPQGGYQQPGGPQPSYPNVPVPGRPNFGK